jgi:hypothetical protein
MSADEAKKPCCKAGRWNFTLVFVVACVLGTLLVAGAIAIFVLSSPKQLILWDIEDKLKPSEPPSGGSSYAKGGCGTGLHIYIDPAEDNNGVESSSNSVSTKVTVHEYIHLIQQSFLNGDASSTTGPVGLRKDATSSTRFHVIYACDFDNQETYGNLHEAVLNAMPDDYKLLEVPTYVILYPSDDAEGKYGCSTMTDMEVTKRANEIYDEIYGSCSGMENPYMGNENHAFAEGEAEYHAMHMTGVWSTYDGPTAWTQKLSEDKGYCDLPSGPKADLLDIKSGSSEDIEAVVEAYKESDMPECADNPIGEVVYASFLDFCAAEGFSCTHKDLFDVWIGSGVEKKDGWCDSFSVQYGKTWGDFVCYMENAYGVDTSNACVPADVPCLEYTDAPFSEFYIYAIVLLLLGVSFWAAGWGWALYKRDPAPTNDSTDTKGNDTDYELAPATTDAPPGEL